MSKQQTLPNVEPPDKVLPSDGSQSVGSRHTTDFICSQVGDLSKKQPFNVKDNFGVNEDALPEYDGYRWAPMAKEVSLGTIVEYERAGTTSERPDAKYRLPPNGGIFISGAELYLKEFGAKVIDIPAYYSHFDTPDYTEKHGYQKYHYRWSSDDKNILGRQGLKWATRLVNGSGRIDEDNTTIVLCSNGSIVADGPLGVFYIPIPKSQRVSLYRDVSIPDPPENIYTDIAGISVPEENQKVQSCLERLFEALTQNTTYPSPESYAGFNLSGNKNHHITFEDERTYTISREGILNDYQHDRDSFSGEFSKYCDGDTYTATVSASELPYDTHSIETISPDSRTDEETVDALILGYKSNWNEKEHVAPTSTTVDELHLNAEAIGITSEMNIVVDSTTIRSFDP